MAYTINLNIPKVRGQAVEMARLGKSVRKVARYFGFSSAKSQSPDKGLRRRGINATVRYRETVSRRKS